MRVEFNDESTVNAYFWRKRRSNDMDGSMVFLEREKYP